jgi:hypothetical protein
MERSLFGWFGSSLLGLSTMGIVAFGFVWPWSGSGGGSGSGAGAPPGKSEGEWRLLEPISYENLTVFPVVTSFGHDTSAFQTLQDGLANGEVSVREQGADAIVRTRDGQRDVPRNYGGPSVNQLVLVNNSKRPLLLLAGELVSGGKQDRIIAKDRIVAPGADPLPLNVFCVEHGRWSAGSKFTAAQTIVHPSVREQAALKQNQNQVWASVAAGSMAAPPPRPITSEEAPRVNADALRSVMSSEAPTQSYKGIYESRQVGGSADSLVQEIDRRFRKATAGLKGEHVVGAVVAYGGEVAWSDVFASHELFEHYWGKLLRSYAVEAVARPNLREKPSMENAGEFLRRLGGREQAEIEPGVYRWSETNDGTLAQIELEALQPKVMTLHRLVVRRTS